MNMLIDELRMLAGDPLAWGAVPVLLAFAGWSVWHWWTCPLIARTAHISRAEALAVLGKPYFAGPRYFLLMVAGIVATVAGLTFIARGINPTLAFYLLLAGVFVIQTEPARLQLREAEYRVVASEALGLEDVESAVHRLESSNVWLITLHGVILVATVTFLLSF